jgi:hypothetical protein
MRFCRPSLRARSASQTPGRIAATPAGNQYGKSSSVHGRRRASRPSMISAPSRLIVTAGRTMRTSPSEGRNRCTASAPLPDITWYTASGRTIVPWSVT